MKKTVFTLCLAALAVLALNGTVRADEVGTLTLSGCGGGVTGCPAATYNFDITSTSATLTVTINGPVGSTNDEIGGVDLGFTTSSNVSGLTLASAPGGTSGWTSTTGSLSNSGCGGNSGAFVCASGVEVPITEGGTYTWTWDFTLGSGSVSGVGDVHVGTNYDPGNGLIVSQTGATTPVPEPGSGTFGLLGLALVSVPLTLRRLYNS